MKNYLLVIFLITLLIACQSESYENKYTISGEVSDLKSGKILLAKLNLSTNDREVLDSTEIRDGKFVINGTSNRIGFNSLIINDTIKVPFFLESGKTTIKFSIKEPQKAIINAGEEQRLFEKHGFAFERDKGWDVIKNYPTTGYAAFTAYYLVQLNNFSGDSLSMIVNQLQGNAHRTDYYEHLKKLADAIKNTSVGSEAPNFSVKDTSGNVFQLKDSRGKYVMLDFWTSWCQPCRANNPKWVKIYEKFSRKNFDIIHVSFDTDTEAWKKAIRTDKLTWKQGCNGKGWDEISDLYGVKSVPQTYLIDPSGKIIGKNLEPEAAEKMLNELVK